MLALSSDFRAGKEKVFKNPGLFALILIFLKKFESFLIKFAKSLEKNFIIYYNIGDFEIKNEFF